MGQTPFLGEIRAISWNFAPKGWAFCNGQLLPINQNQALFSILGTTYGGDGRTTFALPDLRGKVPIHMGNGFTEGQAGGSENVTLTVNQSDHTHGLKANATADSFTATGNFPAAPPQGNAMYGPPPGGGSMDPTLVTTPAGGSQPHNNMQPYLTINYIIALQGIFPSRN
jgi:microcystin-dependent protein